LLCQGRGSVDVAKRLTLGSQFSSGYRCCPFVLADIQEIAVLADNALCPTLDGALEELVVVRVAANGQLLSGLDHLGLLQGRQNPYQAGRAGA
jgi:hypothetical protein